MDGAARDDPQWLDDEQIHDWKAVVALLTTLQAALDTQLKRDAGLNTFEYHVLVALESAPAGTQPMTDLVALTQGSLSRLSHAITRLERSGWVERVACHDARRRTSARLTDAGLQKLREAAPGHVREVRRLVVDALTRDELDALGRCARAIVHEAAPEVAAVLDQE
ncbi:MAG: MarR family transcriptional regulator [Gordonia sp. (in: high G+C Gram-positive bacteria)]